MMSRLIIAKINPGYVIDSLAQVEKELSSVI